ncbi:MAG: hypothetical protein CR967_03265 [Proteobacteria bacterium]|nr:MAG: hypothetical protein CR967_03265 [Pseudomonadota bacterium]
MRWEDQRQSSNIDDRRMQRGSRFGGFRGRNLASALPIAKFLLKSKIGRIVLIVGVVAYFLGFNPLDLLNPGSQNVAKVNSQQDNQTAKFVSVVLAKTEDIWGKIFKQYGSTYEKPVLVLFRGSTQSGCGYASRQTGPFYCPSDHKIYLDLSFFEELKSRHNSPGDFAQAYVIAHEIGHHIQNLSGTLDKIHQKQKALSKSRANTLQVGVELQADCYAGVWAYYMKNEYGLLESGDIEEALNAANAIGDDTLQKQAQGYVVPDSFTHGSSSQRMEWFKKGYQNGDIRACNSIR